MTFDRFKFVLALVLLVSGVSTVYFGNMFLDLQTGCTTFTLEWFEYKNELMLSFAVFLPAVTFAVGLMIYEISHPVKAVEK